MNEEVKQRNRIAKRASVDIYLSGGNGRMYWPHRLQPVHDSTPSVRRKSCKYIIDSGFKPESDNDADESDSESEGLANRQLDDFGPEADGEDVSTEEAKETLHDEEVNQALIDRAHERQPDYIIPNDSIHLSNSLDPADPGHREAIENTAEIVDHFLDLIDEHRFPATVIIPLQPPHDLHYAYLHEHYPEQANRGHFALGGMKDFPPDDQLDCVRAFRRIAGYDAYVHGFGMGASREVILALRDEPELLDSVDFSTVQQHANNAKFAGPSRKPVHVGRSMGAESATTTGSMLAAELTDICRMLSPSLTSEDDIEPSWDKLPFKGPEEDNSPTEDRTPNDDQSGLTTFNTT